MKEIFKTFKPNSSLISKFVDYYYLDVKPSNIETEFKCFPHYTNTISLYKSHVSPVKGNVIFDPTSSPFQIFTPIRETILHVKQIGALHRIVIVFKPLGIQQFYKDLPFSEFNSSHSFFTEQELSKLFETENTATLTRLLDQFLSDRYSDYKSEILSKALTLIFNNVETRSVEEIATTLNISRRHLNRQFNSHFGVSVKKFYEIVLFRKTIEHKLFKNTAQSFTELAHEYNYYDQSHLNKAFKNFTQNSPKDFLSKGTILGNEDTFWHLKK